LLGYDIVVVYIWLLELIVVFVQPLPLRLVLEQGVLLRDALSPLLAGGELRPEGLDLPVLGCDLLLEHVHAGLLVGVLGDLLHHQHRAQGAEQRLERLFQQIASAPIKPATK
jgi:hypothetical protein